MGFVTMVVSSLPQSVEGAHALSLASAFLAGGHQISLFVIQDAVLWALPTQPMETQQGMEDLLARGVECYALQEDLTLRGFGSADLIAGVRRVEHQEIVKAVTAETPGHRIIGCL